MSNQEGRRRILKLQACIKRKQKRISRPKPFLKYKTKKKKRNIKRYVIITYKLRWGFFGNSLQKVEINIVNFS